MTCNYIYYNILSQAPCINNINIYNITTYNGIIIMGNIRWFSFNDIRRYIFSSKWNERKGIKCNNCGMDLTRRDRIFEYGEWRCSQCSQRLHVFGESLK